MSSASPAGAHAYPRLLIIDDDLISREVLGLVLETHGFPVESAADGPEAIRLLDDLLAASSLLPEVILMDSQMPGLSGLDLIAELRSRLPEGQARVIAISGSAVDDSILAATDGFLLKPIETEAFIALLEKTAPVPLSSAQTATPATSGTTIDAIVLAKLKAMMPAASVREIYSATAADLTTRLAALEDAMQTEAKLTQAPEVARIAHAIKGGCAMVGLSAAVAAASRLETRYAPESWKKELAELHGTLTNLQGMLADGLL